MGRVTVDEMQCGCGCLRHTEKVSINFLMKLNDARHMTKSKFVINSGYRCPTYNLSKGFSETSSHIKGMAADIATPDNETRFEVLRTLISVGFKRIGEGDGFVHVDSDTTKPAPRSWTYYDKLRKELKKT
jgi:uncharacterized protein YcbK (DUF882 family)